MTNQNETPSVCPFGCGAKKVSDYKDPVVAFNCGSTRGTQSSDCKVMCYIEKLQKQIACLTAELADARQSEASLLLRLSAINTKAIRDREFHGEKVTTKIREMRLD